jgi:hypothetical protein
MQKLSDVKRKTTWSALLSFEHRCWLPLTVLCLAAIPSISVARPMSRPPPGAGSNTALKEISKSSTPKTPIAAPNPVALPRPQSPAATANPLTTINPRPVPQGAGPASIPQVEQTPPAQQTSPVGSNGTPLSTTQLNPAPRSDNNNQTRIGLPMDPLPANQTPNATALKPITAPVAAATLTSKSTASQGATVATVPASANVQNTITDASGMDSRSASLASPSSALTPGQLTTKLTPLPGNSPTWDLTNQRFNYETKSQAPCTQISTQAHTQRLDTALVDLTGDGLIVSALPNAQLRNSLQMAGYTQIVLNRPASWCLPAAAMSALLRSPAAGAQRSITMPQQKLVQVKGQWQLVQAPTAVNRRSAVNSKSSSNLQVQSQALKIAQRTG